MSNKLYKIELELNINKKRFNKFLEEIDSTEGMEINSSIKEIEVEYEDNKKFISKEYLDNYKTFEGLARFLQRREFYKTFSYYIENIIKFERKSISFEKFIKEVREGKVKNVTEEDFNEYLKERIMKKNPKLVYWNNGKRKLSTNSINKIKANVDKKDLIAFFVYSEESEIKRLEKELKTKLKEELENRLLVANKLSYLVAKQL
ncbi:hypothetical protein Bp8pS_302 [Bacillus phage vB_BpuM-BpSp]|nr:hypothetical protein Bp8pS_302 [Bacillus phage vB_BpuM-BpSp]